MRLYSVQRKNKTVFSRHRLIGPACLMLCGISITGVANASPLALPNPLTFSAGPLGKIDVQGIASGMVFYQDNSQGSAGTLGAKRVGADITNGMVIIQKENGPIQFYIQAGAYSFSTLASSLASATNTISEYGALPMAYLKIVPSSHFSVEIGKLPSLIGVEDAFTYQNINIERGLLWDMEPTVSRGMQFNASEGPLSASLSWNDGYYTNRYNVLTGSLSYALNGSNTLGFYAQGPLGRAPSSSPDIVAEVFATDFNGGLKGL
ncbi:outer membrane beta-barrel protein [Acidithiobacillus thiooxidans]|uniref:Porin n=1 Tax=Acidithiobacillus thiooxidans ATCC 19377 TaxID=637390 RepID=A0A543PZN4_ACITH|nr:outer membrane beta-barrel protein [Acidithiobacillus thiooxidans]MDX5935866.1 outer membrane beta-barrel protein [Acidithiobacillus thiooxidans]TQN49546.1 hypothetical protein DLNHIDIE_03197 [Acidithiobacillus thiooxidans ATCC 19377]